ncbi:MAG: sigma-54-dependent Fis family transcriptional regulator, partial [Acidobacteria bacterium]|nr:sigma-54-dependent Fis family transcriptional regulator [Acidobacteriota bacterium]
MSSKGSILIIDDEQEIRESLEQLLAIEGYQALTASTAEEGLKRVSERVFDLTLLDISLPDRNGLEVLKSIKRDSPETGVIMITAYDSSQMAFQASKEGAESYITKPWDNSRLLVEIRNILDKSRLQVENVHLRRALKRFGLPNIVGKSERMQRVLDLLTQVAPSRATVLIVGESGTGKELVAKTIHATSPRADRPFVPVNTGSMPVDLLESTLFGHVKGAFTSAIAT